MLDNSAFIKVACLAVAIPVSLFAGPVTPASYAMLNGETGTWVYQDTAYLPCPASSCITSNAALSGGVGRLTDGVTSPVSWDNSGNAVHTPVPWVGWTLNPTITFTFAGTPTITQVGLYLDNTPGIGDVRLPASITIASNVYAVAPDPNFGPRWVYFAIPAFTGNTLAVTVTMTPNTWEMLGEVSFDGRTADAGAVPEPATVGLGLLGLGLLAGAGCARRAHRSNRK